jgi:hypothetical protein
MAMGGAFIQNMGYGITAFIENVSGKLTINVRSNYASYVILMVTPDMVTAGSRYYTANTKWVKK